MRWVLLAGRVFLAMGGVYGLVYGLVEHSLRHGLFGGIFFGLLMSIVVTVTTAVRTGRRKVSLSTRQHQTLTVATDPELVRARVLDGLARLHATVVASTPAEIRARTSPSWQMWGENMTIIINGSGGATTLVISSRPHMPTTVFDYGRNRRNIDHLIAWINQPAATGPSAPTAAE